MHVLAVPLFFDATGVVIALTAWARHRCLQLYFLLLFSVLYCTLQYIKLRNKTRGEYHKQHLLPDL